MVKTAQVVFSLDKRATKYDYFYDTETLPKLKKRSLVIVPAGNRLEIGIVYGISEKLSPKATKCVYLTLPIGLMKQNRKVQETKGSLQEDLDDDWRELL